MKGNMMRVAILVSLILAGSACSGYLKSKDGDENGTPNSNVPDGCADTERDNELPCPEGFVADDCDPENPSCELVFEGCSFNHCLNVDAQCLNSAAPGNCEPGWVEVDECPTGNNNAGVIQCEVIEGCAPPFDKICAPITSLDPASFLCPSGDCEEEPPDCMAIQDCALVPSGDVCSACIDCQSEAIHRNELAGYTEAFEAARGMCETDAEVCAEACEEHVAHCDAGTNKCTARRSRYITTDGAPKSCEVNEDCAAVFAGEVCDECMCPNDAVRADFVSTYMDAFDEVCLNAVDCGCAAPVVECVDGMCAIAQ